MLSVDHKISPDAKAPITVLDLTRPSDQKILQDIITSKPPQYVHFGLPCGTCSRARDRPVSQALQSQGAPNPAQLRSAEFPLGLPSIPAGSVNHARVTQANLLYDFAVVILAMLLPMQCVISFENPKRSWFWAAMIQLLLRRKVQSTISAWNKLDDVDFDACCFGSTRQKPTRWKSTSGVFAALRQTCPGDHEHEPYQIASIDGHWKFDTAGEAAYGQPLCQAVAACLLKFLQGQGFHFAPRPPLRHLTLGAQHRQHRKRGPLIPEFKLKLSLPRDTTLTSFQKLLPPTKGEETTEDGKIRVGQYHTPEEFVQVATKLEHPMDSNGIRPETLKAVTQMTQRSLTLSVLEMKTKLLKAKILAKKLENEEIRLHEGCEPSVKKVIERKKVKLTEELLRQTGFEDMEALDFMTKGVPIMGCHNHPDMYKLKLKPAMVTEDDLRASARWRREALIGRRPQTDQPGFLEHLEETAQEEVALGFLEGPFQSEEQVTENLGHADWTVMRRFVIQQGKKLRPIDDGLEAQVNSAYSSTIDLELQDIDYVTTLAIQLGKHGKYRWKGKCLDLSKAYKQLPLWPPHREMAVVHFKSPKGEPRFYIPNSLMFGATAAVFGFNRMSRALWHLLNCYLGVPAAVYFDDFVLFIPEGIAEEVDRVCSEFFTLLGWDHNLTGQKGQPFQFSFDVLGATLDLTKLEDNELTLKNKESRIEKLQEKLENISRRGAMALHEAQELHGLLNFASSFFLGRGLKFFCFQIFQLVDLPEKSNGHLLRWCRDLKTALNASPPRTIPCCTQEGNVLVFTDGSWEQGVAGIGAVVLDPVTNTRLVFEDMVDDRLLEKWRKLVGDQLICQIELVVLVLIRWELKEDFEGRRIFIFVDNNAARSAILKGTSRSSSMYTLVQAFYAVETTNPGYWWLERVPSSSNPSDEPSRLEGSSSASRWNAEFRRGFRYKTILTDWILKALGEHAQNRVKVD